jgi:hypothetical protein
MRIAPASYGGNGYMARKEQRHTANVNTARAREAGDETVGDEGGGRGGRSRGTAARSSSRTTIESRGEVEGDRGPSRDSHATPKGKGSKPDAPRGKAQTSGTGSTGAKKSGNRPGASGTGTKKGTRGSSSRRRSGSRSGGGNGSKSKS